MTSTFGLHNAEERGFSFLGPGVEVYEGMVIGEHAKPGDIAVNVCKTQTPHQHARLPAPIPPSA